MSTPTSPEYSLVVPIYNEEATIPELVRRLAELIGKLDGEAEVILVDDGSSDRSYELMSEAREADPRFKLLTFTGSPSVPRRPPNCACRAGSKPLTRMSGSERFVRRSSTAAETKTGLRSRSRLKRNRS